MSSPVLPCRVCQSQTRALFTTLILRKYEVQYVECPKCGFVQTEEPYWLEEAYSSALTTTDTGTLQRTLTLGKSAAAVGYLLFNRTNRFVDYAGGYGILTRYMRDIGFDFYSTDPYAHNIIGRGFDAQPGHYEMATAFECFEHFVNPAEELNKILAYSDNIFFTTQLCPEPAPAVDQWWYYAPHHGQHIALYRPQTLAYLGQQAGLHYYNIRNYHLFTRRRIPALAFSFSVMAGRFGLGQLVRLLMKSRTLSDAALLEIRS